MPPGPAFIARRVEFAIAAATPVRARPPDSAAVEVWRDVRGIACAFSYTAGGYAWMEMPGAATFRFDARRLSVTAYPEPGVQCGLVEAAYRHAALPVALHYFGAEVLHASAIRASTGVVVFCAVSETGKSTMAAAFGARGYPLWADDAVAIEAEDGAPNKTIRLPFDLRLRAASAAHLGRAPARAGAAHEFATSPLAALCVLERAEPVRGDVSVERLSAGRALAALLPHAFSFSLKDEARKRLTLRRYLHLAARTPVFRVAFAAGFERLPAVLDAIEQTVAGFAPDESAREAAAL
ncbi:MAG TPA: hypothetical protein VFB33_17310 [Candidatus Binataceae bacterium]|nr:hypothetical protein [Candidatus Binataceae bacterium]